MNPFTTIDVQRTYADEELLDRAREIARLRHEVSQLEAEKKVTADGFKEQIGTKEARIEELCDEIWQGYEVASIACDVVLNQPAPGMKSYISQETLKVVKTCPMTDEDRQKTIWDGPEE